jgi:hypothetical protein
MLLQRPIFMVLEMKAKELLEGQNGAIQDSPLDW